MKITKAQLENEKAPVAQKDPILGKYETKEDQEVWQCNQMLRGAQAPPVATPSMNKTQGGHGKATFERYGRRERNTTNAAYQKTMKIHWLIPGSYKTAEDLIKSNLASIRMRAGLVGKFAHAMQFEFSAGDQINTKADVIVVGKIGGDCLNGRENLWIKQLAEAKKQSKKIILDYTDHHLGSLSSPMGAFYKNILPIINKAVVPSTRISKLLEKKFNQEIIVIEDPVEIQTIYPIMSIPTGEMTLLWFGHATNISYLVNYLQDDFLCDADFRLFVLSNGPGLKELASHQQSLRSTIKLEFVEWSLQNMINASKISHGCLIPSDVNDPSKSGASSNRLITAFALGLPVSAEVLESYAPFTDYFHNVRETPLSAFINQLALYTKKVETAQERVVPMFSQKVIAKKWERFFLTARRIA